MRISQNLIKFENSDDTKNFNKAESQEYDLQPVKVNHNLRYNSQVSNDSSGDQVVQQRLIHGSYQISHSSQEPVVLASISRDLGYENKVTQPGATLGEPEDSSIFNSQTNHNIKEIDIDIEVGGFVSNLSHSSNLFLPKITKTKKLDQSPLLVSPTDEMLDEESSYSGGPQRLPTLKKKKYYPQTIMSVNIDKSKFDIHSRKTILESSPMGNTRIMDSQRQLNLDTSIQKFGTNFSIGSEHRRSSKMLVIEDGRSS